MSSDADGNGTGGWRDVAVVRAVAALDDPSRRALYTLIRSRTEPVTRESAAAEVGISRKLAAFHLDKLVEAGLLTATFDPARRSRTMGRTPKVYQPSALQVSLTLPERRHALLTEILLEGVTSARSDESPRDAVLQAGEAAGKRLGASVRAPMRRGRLAPERAIALAETVLHDHGYEPVRAGSGCLRLRNCPFQPFAEQATDVICGLNHRFISGFLQGLETPALSAILAPRPDQCCVEICRASPGPGADEAQQSPAGAPTGHRADQA